MIVGPFWEKLILDGFRPAAFTDTDIASKKSGSLEQVRSSHDRWSRDQDEASTFAPVATRRRLPQWGTDERRPDYAEPTTRVMPLSVALGPRLEALHCCHGSEAGLLVPLLALSSMAFHRENDERAR